MPRPGKEFTTGNLTITARLLHFIFAKIIHARTQNFAQLLNYDLVAVWCLLKGKQVDWGQYVLDNMLSVRTKTSPLPYACLVMRILRDAGISFAGEAKEKPHGVGTIGSRTLNQSGIIHLEGIGWVNRECGQCSQLSREDHPDRIIPPSQARAEASSSAAAAAAGPAAASPELMELLTHGFQDMRSYMDVRFTALEAKVDAQGVQLAEQSRVIQELQRSVATSQAGPSGATTGEEPWAGFDLDALLATLPDDPQPPPSPSQP